MLLFNGSDACVAAGNALTVQLMSIFVGNYTDLLRRSDSITVAGHELSTAVDRASVERIILNMKQERLIPHCKVHHRIPTQGLSNICDGSNRPLNHQCLEHDAFCRTTRSHWKRLLNIMAIPGNKLGF